MTFAENNLTSWSHIQTELFEGMCWRLSCLDCVYHSTDMIARQIEEIKKAVMRVKYKTKKKKKILLKSLFFLITDDLEEYFHY